MKIATNIKYLSLVLFYLAIFFIIGEVDFRLINRVPQLKYDVDEQLYHRLAPEQTGYLWLGGHSFRSPDIHINSLGFRSAEIDLSDQNKYRILVTGSSIAFGPGVVDSYLWSNVLQEELNKTSGKEKIEVLNGANPGWGPFQWSIFLKRYIPIIKPELLVVFYSTADISFFPIEDKEKEREFIASAKIKKRLISISAFLAYCYRRLNTQLLGLKNNLKLEKINGKNGEKISPEMELICEKQNNYFIEIAEIANTNRIPVIFIVISLDKPKLGEYLFERVSFLKKKYVYVNVLYLGQEILQGRKYENIIVTNDGHLNNEGHRIIADNILSFLKTPSQPFQLNRP